MIGTRPDARAFLSLRNLCLALALRTWTVLRLLVGIYRFGMLFTVLYIPDVLTL